MTSTTIVRPADASLRAALQLAALFAALKLVFHVLCTLWQMHLGYGYFRDEFYYLVCGEHLAWGYVDHGPIVALQAKLSSALFGHTILGIRMLSALAGAARVALTGILAWSLGGRRPAQTLAMLAVLCSPNYLAIDGFLSMNSCESLFWMPCILALIMIQRGSNPAKWWTILGISAGLGLLNKPSMAFFLIALGIALLLTPQRRLLFTRHAAWGIALLILVASPNLLWQMHNHWPTLEFLHNGRVENKNIRLGPLSFLLNQLLVLGPITAFVWIAGLLHLMHLSRSTTEADSHNHRYLALTYILFLAAMIAFGAKDYYVIPIYPILYAAGGLAWERRFANHPRVQQQRAIAFPILAAVLILAAVVFLPFTNPVLRPQTFITYQHALHVPSTDSENEKKALLPQFFADRFGWNEELDEVTRIVNTLSPEDRAKAGIVTSNYGEAASLEVLGKGRNLPPVICGHNNYFLWGPHDRTGEVVIIITGGTLADMQQNYDDVQIAGQLNHPFSMPYEQRNIYLARHRKQNLTIHWIDLKHYI